MSARLFVVGDIHGMSDELDRLVAELAPIQGDRFSFLGDLVDRGPDSLGVIARVRDLIARFPGSMSICGNHEESAIRLKAKADKAGSWSAIGKAEKEPWLTKATNDDFAFLTSLPLYGRPFPDKSFLLVHGGLFPAYFDHYPGLPELTPNWHKTGGKQMDRARRFLRVRHVHKTTGKMIPLGEESDETRPWAECYDGREGYVFYGHEPQRTGIPAVHRHAMGLDTGAVFGGYLTAAVVVEGKVANVYAILAQRSGREWREVNAE